METLGDDLVLLAIRPSGVIAAAARLRYGLSGSELVRLAALRRITIERARIVVLDAAPTGDALLDEALTSMDGQPKAKEWVAHDRDELVRRYLERLAVAGTIQLERRKALGFIPVDGWTILDPGRLAAARARLDVIALGTGAAGMPEVALTGLAAAVGLPPVIYPGFGGAGARRRIARVARVRSVGGLTQVGGALADGYPDTATLAAADAAVRAATDASIDAATQAAISATADAAHSAHHAAGGGGHVGGHH